MELFQNMNSYTQFVQLVHDVFQWLYQSTCAFSWQGCGKCSFYLSGPELWSVTVYYHPFKHFNQDCSEACSSLQHHCCTRLPSPPLPPWLWRRLPPLGQQQIHCPLQMCFVQWSIKFGITVLVHLIAACTCKPTGKVSKLVEKQQCSKIGRCHGTYLRRRGISIPLQEGSW
jgi:hypothetical protein